MPTSDPWTERATAEIMGSQQPTPTLRDPDKEWLDAATAEIMAMPEPTLGQRALEPVKNLVGGALRGTATAIEGAAQFGRGVLEKGLDPRMRNAVEEQTQTSLPGVLEQAAPTPDFRIHGVESFLTQELPSFIGGLGPYAASMIVDPIGGPMVLMGLQGGASAHADALANGASTEDAQTAFWLGAGVNAAAAPVLGGVFSKWDSLSGKGLTKALQHLAVSGGSGVAAGAAMRIMANQIHNYATDDDRALLDGVAKDAAVMGIGGALLHTAIETARNMRGKPTQPGSPDEMLAVEQSFQEAAKGKEPEPTRTEIPESPQKPPAPLPESSPPAPERPPSTPEARAEGERAMRQWIEEELIRAGMSEGDVARVMVAADVKAAESATVPETGKRAARASEPAEKPITEAATRALKIHDLATEPDVVRLALEHENGRPTLERRGELRSALEKAAGFDLKPVEIRSLARKGAARALEAANPQLGSPERSPPNPELPYDPSTTTTIQPAEIAAPVGGRLEGTLANTLPSGAPTTTKQSVVNALVAVLRAAGSNSPVLQGRAPEWAAGVFQVLPNVVRIQKWGDIYVASHEIGHALERAVFGWTGQNSPWSGANALKNGIGHKMQGELYRLGRALYGSNVPAGGYLREGFAEYVRTWISNPDALMKDAPEFTRWFDRTFLPANEPVMRAMEAARTEATTWRLQGAQNRAMGNAYFPDSLRQRATRWLNQLRYTASMQAWVRGEQAWVMMQREIERGLGRKLGPLESPVEAMDALRRQSEGVMRVMTEEHTMLDDGVTITGPSLKTELAPARGSYDEMFLYLWAKRALATWNMRKPVVDSQGNRIAGVAMHDPRDPGLSLEDAHYLVNEIETKHPGVPKAADGLHAWSERVNDYIASLDPEMGAKLKSMDALQQSLHPGGFESNYVPLHRWMEDMDSWARNFRSSGGKARRMDLTKAMEGSGRPVKDIMPEVLKQVHERIQMAHIRVPILRSLEILDAHPQLASPFIRVADPKFQAAYQSALNAARAPLVVNGELPTEAADMVGSAMSFFSKPFIPPGGRDPILPIYRNGKMIPYEINRDLYAGLTHLRSYQFDKTWRMLLTVPKNLQVMGWTGMRLGFGLIKNPMVDLPSFVLNTKYYGNPLEAFGHWAYYAIYSLFDGATMGAAHKLLKDPYYSTWKNIGAEMGQSYYVNADRPATSARRLLNTKLKSSIHPAAVIPSFVDYVASLVNAGEKAGRIAEVKGGLKAAGWDGKSPLTPEMVQKARIDSKQVTIDFTQAGDIARAANQAIPFFNSPIQGGVAFARAAAHHPIRFAATLGAYLGASVALWNLNKDEEFYTETQIGERARSWMWKAKINGQDTVALWKKPQEVGSIITVMEELLDACYRGRSVRFGDTYKAVTDALLPPGMNQIAQGRVPTSALPVLVSEPLQQLSNLDYFTQRPIIPDRLKNLDTAGYASEQHGEQVTAAAEFAGSLFNVSPNRADHFFRALFGGVGTDLLDGLGFGPRLGDREKTPADMPVAGVAFKRGGLLNSQAQSLNDLYTQLDIADGRSKSVEHPETPEQARLRMMLLDYAAAVSALSYIHQTYAKTQSERGALMGEMVRIAREGSAKALAGTWDPVSGQMHRDIAAARKTVLDLEHGIVPRNMR